MRLSLILIAALAVFMAPNFFRSGWDGTAEAEVTEAVAERPRLAAVMFRSSWCSACRIIEPRVEDVRADYEDAAIGWVKFDFTLGRRESLRELAEAEGLTDIYSEAAGSTGFMLLIDRETGQVFEMITMDYGRDQIREALDRWLRVVERLETEGV
ncbi:thioredoxin domain-containing protein [Maricaulis maris]|uniref:Thioredoxin n=1 Tax=Maricaulis maris TaxID=74318 RepID=A0A495DDQ9_9PROT|nr:thioredoxin family protein [Maricaulis maris]RKR00055.1 thioredoxin [Maricaulis maris]